MFPGVSFVDMLSLLSLIESHLLTARQVVEEDGRNLTPMNETDLVFGFVQGFRAGLAAAALNRETAYQN